MSSSGDDAGDATDADAPSDGAGGNDDADDGDGVPGSDAADEDDGDGRKWWQRSDPEPPSIGPEVPEVDVPEVDIPGSGDPVGGDVDVETAKGFWRLVLIFDVALLALALGPMFVYFEGDLRRGGTLVAFGALVFAYGVARYREFRNDGNAHDDGLEESPADEGTDEA